MKKKTALITGASRGIGAACARSLSLDGFNVIINYLNSTKQANSLAEELGAVAVKADVSDFNQVVDMLSSSGEIDVLVCNAGVSLFKLFSDTTHDEIHRLLGVNFEGTVNCIKAALPAMIRRQSGTIITISSVWGVTGASCESVYSASKAAVIGLSKALAKELGPSGITVNCIAPGIIDTDMNLSLTEDVLEDLKQETPLGTIGVPDDIAALVSFLASDRARFITGQVFGVNGGFYI